MSWRKHLPWILLIVGWFLIGWFARGLAPQGNAETALFQQARQTLANEYYGELPPPRQLTYAAIRGMLSDLGDKYAEFYEPTMAERDSEAMRGNDAVNK